MAAAVGATNSRRHYAHAQSLPMTLPVPRSTAWTITKNNFHVDDDPVLRFGKKSQQEEQTTRR